MKRALVLASAMFLALFAAALVQASPITWAIDPVHSEVGFTIRHIWSKVPGKFTKFDGTIVYDPQNPAAASVKAVIEAASINTGNEMRDGDLKSGKFFDVAKYPTITFQSVKVTPATDGALKVEGNLTMHGVTKPVTLDAKFLGAGPGMEGEPRSGFEATTTVNRKDFGIVWNKTLDQGQMLLGDDVTIRINIEGVSEPEAPEPKAGAKAEATPVKEGASKQ